MSAWLSKNRIHILLAVCFITLFLLLQVDALHRFAANFSEQELTQQNLAYLNHAEKEARHDFTRLSEIFAILEVVKSGQVGISFFVDVQVKIGHVLASFSDIVERGIAVSIAAASATVALKSLVNLAELLSPLLFKLTLPLLALYFIAASFNSKHIITLVSRVLCEVTVLLFLTAYLLIPYSIHGTGWLSQHITAEMKQEGREHLNNIHQEVTRTGNGKLSLKQRAEHAMHDFEKIVLHLPQKVESMSLYLTRHIAASVVEALLLPLGLFLMLWFSLRQIVRRIGQLVQSVPVENEE